jgi:hypothetical protein
VAVSDTTVRILIAVTIGWAMGEVLMMVVDLLR